MYNAYLYTLINNITYSQPTNNIANKMHTIVNTNFELLLQIHSKIVESYKKLVS